MAAKKKTVGPVEGAPQPRKPGSEKGKVRLSPDFDQTPPDFKDYQ